MALTHRCSRCSDCSSCIVDAGSWPTAARLFLFSCCSPSPSSECASSSPARRDLINRNRCRRSLSSATAAIVGVVWPRLTVCQRARRRRRRRRRRCHCRCRCRCPSLVAVAMQRQAAAAAAKTRNDGACAREGGCLVFGGVAAAAIAAFIYIGKASTARSRTFAGSFARSLARSHARARRRRRRRRRRLPLLARFAYSLALSRTRTAAVARASEYARAKVYVCTLACGLLSHSPSSAPRAPAHRTTIAVDARALQSRVLVAIVVAFALLAHTSKRASDIASMRAAGSGKRVQRTRVGARAIDRRCRCVAVARRSSTRNLYVRARACDGSGCRHCRHHSPFSADQHRADRVASTTAATAAAMATLYYAVRDSERWASSATYFVLTANECRHT